MRMFTVDTFPHALVEHVLDAKIFFFVLIKEKTKANNIVQDFNWPMLYCCFNKRKNCFKILDNIIGRCYCCFVIALF